jgi:prepilin-type N-terminal cleavage/methylation domain-containing protein
MKRNGFSLMELVIVLIIIGFSISLVMPSLSRFSKSVELKATAKKVSGILRYYRSEAAQKGKVHQVLFDPDLREVIIQLLESTEDKSTNKKGEEMVQKNKYHLPDGIQIKELKIPSPQYPADFPAIEFYPNGGSNGGSILLDSQDQRGYRIKVHFLTGIVEIEGV